MTLLYGSNLASSSTALTMNSGGLINRLVGNDAPLHSPLRSITSPHDTWLYGGVDLCRSTDSPATVTSDLLVGRTSTRLLDPGCVPQQAVVGGDSALVTALQQHYCLTNQPAFPPTHQHMVAPQEPGQGQGQGRGQGPHQAIGTATSQPEQEQQ